MVSARPTLCITTMLVSTILILLLFTTTAQAAILLKDNLIWKPGSAVELSFDLFVTPKVAAEEITEWDDTVEWTFSPARGGPFLYNVAIWLLANAIVSPRKWYSSWAYEYLDNDCIRLTYYWTTEEEYNLAYPKLRDFLNGPYGEALATAFKASVEGFTHQFSSVGYFQRYLPARCFDGEKNYGESGIDCGGDHTGCPRCAHVFDIIDHPQKPDTGMLSDVVPDPLLATCQTSRDCIEFTECVTLDKFLDRYGQPSEYYGTGDNRTVCSWYNGNIKQRNYNRPSNSAVSIHTYVSIILIVLSVSFL